MKKTKHFNISVPELGDVPDITQVSNAISDLEDATAGTLEIMKAEMQGNKITLTSVSRKTKRTGYYEGMSIRFKSPQDIEPNYLKTISVDELGDQELSVAYKVNRNEYIDIVYEGNKFTAYPVVVQKTDSVNNNSSVLVGTAKGVKTAYDKGVEALNKATQAQSSANNAQSTADGKVSKNGDTMTGTLRLDAWNNNLRLYGKGEELGLLAAHEGAVILKNTQSEDAARLYLNTDGGVQLKAKNLATQSKEVVEAINELNSGKENKINKKSGFNLDKSDSVTSNSSNTIATSLAVKTAYDKAGQAQSTADGKVSKSGDTMTGDLDIKTGADETNVRLRHKNGSYGTVTKQEDRLLLWNAQSSKSVTLFDSGDVIIPADNLKTNNKEVVSAINELNSKKLNLSGGDLSAPISVDTDRGDNVVIRYKGKTIGSLTCNEVSLSLYNSEFKNGIKLTNSGEGTYPATNLIWTNKKDLTSAVNEINSRYKVAISGVAKTYYAPRSICVPNPCSYMRIDCNSQANSTTASGRTSYSGPVIKQRTGLDVNQNTGQLVTELYIVYDGSDGEFNYYHLENVNVGEDNFIVVFYK